MKNSINGWVESQPWPELAISEVTVPMVRVNNINQYNPWHYQEKNWVTDEIVKRFEYEYRI